MATVKAGKKAPSKFVLGARDHEPEKKTDRSEKIFLLRLPAQLCKQAREKAASRTISLRQFILEAIEKASRRK
jgi:predicted HicB family RNase H-like nuclease